MPEPLFKKIALILARRRRKGHKEQDEVEELCQEGSLSEPPQKLAKELS